MEQGMTHMIAHIEQEILCIQHSEMYAQTWSTVINKNTQDRSVFCCKQKGQIELINVTTTCKCIPPQPCAVL